MAKYIIDETTLVGFGDQARRLGNVEGELTTAQMQDIFQELTASSPRIKEIVSSVTIDGGSTLTQEVNV